MCVCVYIYVCIYQLSYINSFNPLQKSYETDLFNLHWYRNGGHRYVDLTYPGFHTKLEFTGVLMWRRQWQPPPVPLPGKSRGWRSLIYYSPWGRKETDMTEQLQRLQHIEWAHFNLITSLKTLSLDKATFWGTENSSHNTVHHSLAPQRLLLLFSCPAVSNSLWPHRLQRGRPSLSLTVSWRSLP